MTDPVLGLADNNGEENRIGEWLKAVVRSQGLKAAGPPGRWEQSPGPYKMHVSSQTWTCGKPWGGACWGWGTWAADGQGCPHLTSASLLFPPPCPPLCCRLPSRRKQTPCLASPRWPRQGWRSSRFPAAGPPSAASWAPRDAGAPGPRDPSHPLVFRAPISPGPKSSPRQKGLKASP